MAIPAFSPTPEPLRGSDLGTFAHLSVVKRLPQIGRRTLAENDFPPDVHQAFEHLIDEIPTGRIRGLNDSDAPDAEAWDSYVAPYLGYDWLQVPWFFAEFYFYRRVLETTGYFQGGHGGFRKDPFHHQKSLGIRTGTDTFARVMDEFGEPGPDRIEEMLLIDLWANRADLSMWPLEEGEGEMPNTLVDRTHILVDQSAAIAERIRDPKMRVDLILDNTGFELNADLWLAETLLRRDFSEVVYLHPKSYPIFVSDVIKDDLYATIDQMMKCPSERVSSTALRVGNYLQEGRLQIADDLFWNSPLAMWEMPDGLYEHLAISDLVLFKGDMNYRRLLGDRHWNFDTQFEEVMRYFPTPVGALRALKAEVACGLERDQIEDVAREDPEWMVNGRWGLIQFRG